MPSVQAGIAKASRDHSPRFDSFLTILTTMVRMRRFPRRACLSTAKHCAPQGLWPRSAVALPLDAFWPRAWLFGQCGDDDQRITTSRRWPSCTSTFSTMRLSSALSTSSSRCSSSAQRSAARSFSPSASSSRSAPDGSSKADAAAQGASATAGDPRTVFHKGFLSETGMLTKIQPKQKGFGWSG